MKNTIKLATTLVLFSSVLGSVTAFAAGETDTATTKGNVTFEAGGGEPPVVVDPEEKPGKPVEPGDKPGGESGKEPAGPLQIVFVPNLEFGTQKVSAQDKVYPAELQTVNTLDDNGVATGEVSTRANYVQVADLSGEQAGWNLKVTQDTELANGEDKLVGAVITFKNAVVKEKENGTQAQSDIAGELTLTPGTAAKMMSATAGTGMVNNSMSFGNATADEETAKQSVTLSIPESAIQKAGTTYSTNLVWNLEQGPANEEA